MLLIVRLTKDAVVTQLKDERKVVNFTVAINDYYKPKGSDKGVTVTTYISCAYWISTAVASLLKKGSLVEVSGRFTVTAYKDVQGEARGSLNCHVAAIKLHQQVKTAAEKPAVKEPEPGQDDLPF